MADELTAVDVEGLVREAVANARLSGHEFSPAAVDRIRRMAAGELTMETAIGEIVAACPADLPGSV